MFKSTSFLFIIALLLISFSFSLLNSNRSNSFLNDSRIITPKKDANYHYKINLDESFILQYKEIIQDKTPYLKELIQKNQDWLNLSLFNTKVAEMVSKGQRFDWNNRIDAISQISGIDRRLIITFNMLYDYFCTSAIVKNGQTNQLYVARNLDFNFTEDLANLAFIVEAYRGEKLIYIAQGIAGLLGYTNGMRPNLFSMSANQRVFPHFKKYRAIKNFSKGLIGQVYSFYEALESNSYEELFYYLSTVQLNSPVYFIIAGEKEGSIIARDIDKPALIDRISVDDVDKWFLVQTNYDRILPDPEFDLRRTPAENYFNGFNSTSITYDDVVYSVLGKAPVRVKTTAFTSVMNPFDNNYFKTTLWVGN